jgi:hypothetical protein
VTVSEDHRSFAAVILAGGATAADSARLAEMVQVARADGAVAVVCAVPRGWRAPERARVVHVAPGASPSSALRAGLAQLGNSTARFVMLWPLADRTMPDMVVPRERWLELMTSDGDVNDTVLRLGVPRSSL